MRQPAQLRRDETGRPYARAGLLLLCGLLAAPAAAQHNVLLILADDLGVDRVGAYGEHPDPGRTPVLDALAAEGLLFRNAWSDPVCSPTRATILTGRHGFRTGIGKAITYVAESTELALGEVTLPKILRPAYRAALAGKWHLTSRRASGPAHPLLMGFEHHRGPIASLPKARGEQAYFRWTKSVDGREELCTTYATTDTVDEALALLRGFAADEDEKPWFLWVAFNAPHKPYHHPPDELHGFDLPRRVRDGPLFMKALTEAMDTEIGRLLEGLEPSERARTVVLFLGDNGTVGSAVTPPFDPAQGKGLLFEGGINVPLIVSGPGVPRGAECRALVNTTDLFATVAEIGGLELAGHEDSISLVPYFSRPQRPSLRSWVYAERFLTAARPRRRVSYRAVRGPRYKLMLSREGGRGRQRLYDLRDDPFERIDLLQGELAAEPRAEHERLLALLRAPGATTWTNPGGGRRGARGVPALLGLGLPAPGVPLRLEARFLPPGAEMGLLLLRAGAAPAWHDGLPGPLLGVRLACLRPTAPGSLGLSAPWPAGPGPGARARFQACIPDPSAASGLALSNALVLRVP